MVEILTIMTSIEKISSAEPLEAPASEEFFFDDQPIESVLGVAPPSPPTPANVLRIWKGDFDRSDAVARAIAAILCNDQGHVQGFAEVVGIEQCLRNALTSGAQAWAADDPRRAACLAALGMVAQTHRRMEEAEDFLRQALELQKKHLGGDHPETCATTERLAVLLDQVGRAAEAERLRRSLSIEQLLHAGQGATALRVQALELFQRGEYNEAERIYRRLIAIGFELASTHCHLARICLMTKREGEAAQETERAWGHRHQAPAYVIPRILFLRVVCVILGNGSVKSLLQELERALQEPGACLTWTMQPVIRHLKTRFTTDQFALLASLVEALGESEKLRNLNADPLWRDATRQEPADLPSQP